MLSLIQGQERKSERIRTDPSSINTFIHITPSYILYSIVLTCFTIPSNFFPLQGTLTYVDFYKDPQHRKLYPKPLTHTKLFVSTCPPDRFVLLSLFFGPYLCVFLIKRRYVLRTSLTTLYFDLSLKPQYDLSRNVRFDSLNINLDIRHILTVISKNFVNK